MIGRVAVVDFCRGSRMARSEERIAACEVCQVSFYRTEPRTHEGRAVVIDRTGVGAELARNLAQAGAIARADHAVESHDDEAVSTVRLGENVERAVDDLRSEHEQRGSEDAPPTCRQSARR